MGVQDTLQLYRNQCLWEDDRMTETDIRRCLLVHGLARYANDPSTIIVQELAILQGATRVDIAVLNGTFLAYEIKSPNDTLVRLPYQAHLYNQVFDRVTLVLSEKHYNDAVSLLPSWWAVAIATQEHSDLQINLYRNGADNPAPNPRAIAELLWRDEALALLVEQDADRGIRSKPRRYLWDRLCEVLTPEDLKHAVLNKIKARSGWPASSQLQ